MNKVIEMSKDPKEALAKIIVRFVLDPWIGMLAFGALGHRLHIPFLLHIGFFESLLIVIIWQTYTPITVTKWTVKDAKE